MKPSRSPQVEATTKLGFTLGKTTRVREIMDEIKMNAHQREMILQQPLNPCCLDFPKPKTPPCQFALGPS